jgi:hypothetical protein
MKKITMIALLAIGVILIAANTQQFDYGGSHKIDPKVEAAVIKVLDDFMVSFNARDLKAHYDTYQFPHYRLASGTLTTLEKPNLSDSTIFLKKLIQAGWHHTQWDHRNIIQASHDKVHVDTQFTRYRADGSKIKTYESLYVLTYENNRWGIKMRSSFAE